MTKENKLFSIGTVDGGRHSGEKVGSGQRMDYVMLGPEQLKGSIGVWGHDKVVRDQTMEQGEEKEERKKGQTSQGAEKSS